MVDFDKDRRRFVTVTETQTTEAGRTAAPYRQRELASLVREALEALPVVVVTGLRQAGKTTFLRQDPLLRGRRYYSLDDFATLEAARQEPESLLRGDRPVTIDEAQKCPELLQVIKSAVDESRVPGRYLLSGSANFALLRDVSESLAGRAIYLDLHPFTRRERTGRIGTTPFVCRLLDADADPSDLLDVDLLGGPPEPVVEEEILEGGLPSIVLGETANRALWLLGYEQTYLERDVRALTQVGDLVAFRNLLQLAALRGGNVLNASEVARDAKLPATTVSRYLGVLEASFVIRRLAPYLKSPATRLIKSPKLFLSDSGLAAHLTGVDDVRPTADEPLRGMLYETYVLQNLAGILSAHIPRAEIAFWSVQGRHEVDFVIADGRRSVAIEVKAGSRFGKNDLTGLRAFLEKTPGVTAGVLGYTGGESVSLGERLFAVPLSSLLA